MNLKTSNGWWVQNIHGGIWVSFVDTPTKERKGNIAKFPEETITETMGLVEKLSGMAVEAVEL
jgi:hypothetical protein